MTWWQQWEHILETIGPYKGVVAGTFGLILATIASALGKLWQRRRDDAEPREPGLMPTPRPTVLRLHGEDRELVGELRDTVRELTRTARHLTTAVEDQSDACRRGRRRDEGEGRPA